MLYGIQRLTSSFLKAATVSLACVLLVAGLVFLAAHWALDNIRQSVATYLHSPLPASSKLVTTDGQLMYEFFDHNRRYPVDLAEMSPNVIKTTVAAEDQEFFHHAGISLPAILRSAVLDYLIGGAHYGGSTITQQLVKNTVVGNEQSFNRKLVEAVWAYELERQASKTEILERYLNVINYGRNSSGIEAASQMYFGVHAKDLTLAQSAYLAALPRAPGRLSPSGPGRADLDQSKTEIIHRLANTGQITLGEKTQALTTTPQFISYRDHILFPHYTLWVRDQLVQNYGAEKLYGNGFTVTASLDPQLQVQAEHLVEDYAAKQLPKVRASNTALVAVEPATGLVKVMVGSKSYWGASEPSGCIAGQTCTFDPKTNVATSLRQVGSSFKPYVYLTAMSPEFGYSPASLVSDISKSYGNYRPQNYTGQQFGRVPLRKALAGSLNIAAVNTLAEIGLPPVISQVRKLGITAPMEQCGLSLALGSCEISLLEHTAAIAGIANLGSFTPATGYSKIVDSNGKLIYEHRPAKIAAADPQAAYSLLNILSDNSARAYIFGKNNPLTLGDRAVAAKTGTSQNWKDAVAVGSTVQLTAGVWVGNNNGKLMREGADSIISAAPLWHSFMEQASAEQPLLSWQEPDGITTAWVNTAGKIVSANTPGARKEIFPAYSLPSPKAIGLRTKVKNFIPKIAGVSTATNTETVRFLRPLGNSILYAPESVLVDAGSSVTETVVSFYIDGKLIAEKSAPFLFELPHDLSNNWHTLKVKATYFTSFESEASIKIKTQYNPPPVKPRG